jgi:hypothetical protein
MTSIKDLYPDKWLRPEHFTGKRPRVFIAAATIEHLFNPRTRRNEPKIVVAFHGKTLRLVCNKTQAHALAAITGSQEIENWQGHEIVLSIATAPNGSPTILITGAPTNNPTTITTENA